MLSVYPGMSLDLNFSQAVPSTHGFSRGTPMPPPPPTTNHHHHPFGPYLAAASFSTSSTSMGSVGSASESPAVLFDTTSSFGFAPNGTMTSAGATHSTAFMPSPPPPPTTTTATTFLPPQEQPSSSSSTTTSRTLASGSSPTTSIQYSPVTFDQHHFVTPVTTTGCLEDSSAQKLMATTHGFDDFTSTTHTESGLPVDPCVYSRSNGSSPLLAGPMTVSTTTAPMSLALSHHPHHSQPQQTATNLSPTIPYHHHQPHHNHHGYHPYMYPGLVGGPTTEPVVQSNKRGGLRSPAMYSPVQQSQSYYHQQPTMHCQPYKRRSSATTSRSSSPTSTIHSDHGGMPQNMMATFNTKVSSSTPKRYKCAVCFKKFTRPSSLTTHMYSHTGEKPFKCPVDGCGRHFSVVSNLRRHAKIHNNLPINNNNNNSNNNNSSSLSATSSPASSSCSS